MMGGEAGGGEIRYGKVGEFDYGIGFLRFWD